MATIYTELPPVLFITQRLTIEQLPVSQAGFTALHIVELPPAIFIQIKQVLVALHLHLDSVFHHLYGKTPALQVGIITEFYTVPHMLMAVVMVLRCDLM